MLCISILMLQEVVLKVVTPPTFTNTSESEVRVETGRPAALFCHAKGRQLISKHNSIKVCTRVRGASARGDLESC